MDQATIGQIIDTLKAERIDLVVTLPEEPTSPLTEEIARDPYFTSVTVSGEGHGISLCAGASIGGWIAAEIAVRVPERVLSLALIGAAGLFVPQHPIADIFMMVQAKNGGDYADFRRTLFRQADAPEALAMFPDGRMPVERELLRYRMFRFASRIGFAPPYLHDRKLRDRLNRFAGPAVVIAGERDNLVPVAHARAYAQGLRNAALQLLADAGHSVAVEKPNEVAAAVLSCVNRAGAAVAVA